jgi:hypothetical protein
MTQIQIPLAANTAEGDITGQEKLVNVFPEKSTGGKYPFTLKHCPGLAFFVICLLFQSLLYIKTLIGLLLLHQQSYIKF